MQTKFFSASTFCSLREISKLCTGKFESFLFPWTEDVLAAHSSNCVDYALELTLYIVATSTICNSVYGVISSVNAAPLIYSTALYDIANTFTRRTTKWKGLLAF